MGQPGNPEFVGTYTVDFAFSYDPGTVIAGEPVNFPNYHSYYYDGTKVRYMMSGTMTISGTEGNYTIAIDMKDDESKDVKMTYTGDVYFYDESGDDEPVNPGTGGVVFLETFGIKLLRRPMVRIRIAGLIRISSLTGRILHAFLADKMLR